MDVKTIAYMVVAVVIAAAVGAISAFSLVPTVSKSDIQTLEEKIAKLSTQIGPKTQKFDILLGEGEILGEEPLEKLGVPEHSIVGEFHRWEPNVMVVKKGDKVILTVKNPRKAVHSFLLPAFNVNTGPLAPRTGVKTVEFVADKAGVFSYMCGIPYNPKAEPHECDPDHKRMVGYLIVLE